MFDVINGKLTKRGRRKYVGDEQIIGPEHAPERARKYARKALCALPPIVKGDSDREDRAAGLAIAMISELGQMPREQADPFVQSLQSAYAELIEAYGQEKQLLLRQAQCA
jgi:hypothetical protein